MSFFYPRLLLCRPVDVGLAEGQVSGDGDVASARRRRHSGVELATDGNSQGEDLLKASTSWLRLVGGAKHRFIT